MSDQMTRWERVRAALNGDQVDRPPASVWRHFYHRENSAAGLAEAMLGFQQRYGWDFMKVNPRESYHAEDWGLKLRFSDNDSQSPETVDWPIKTAEDFKKIEPLDIHQGVLGEQLEALKLIADGLGGQVPFLMTIFTPLSIAGYMAGSHNAMEVLLRENPKEVHGCLEVISETFSRYAAECVATGAAGLFFATTGWATYDRLSDDEYDEFGRPYDLRVLRAVSDAEFNVLHVCGSNNMLSTLKDYPVAAFNWDTQDETNVWLNEGGKITQKAVIGGITHRSNLLDGKPEEVAEEAVWTKDTMEITRWMLGPGCTIPAATPHENLQALSNVFSGR